MDGSLIDRGKWLRIASLLGTTGVVLMALAAHALKKVLAVDQLEAIHSAVLLQMLHAIAILALSQGAQAHRGTERTLRLWLWGTLLFSGSIYLLLAKPMLPFLKYLWPLTPLGGMVLIAGWGLLMRKD